MIIDIRFRDSAPRQYQKVKMTTVYTASSAGSAPELVIRFYDALYPQVNIDLARIVSVQTTND